MPGSTHHIMREKREDTTLHVTFKQRHSMIVFCVRVATLSDLTTTVTTSHARVQSLDDWLVASTVERWRLLLWLVVRT